ncbi:polyprenyl synthetase family protein [Phytoactinopolyspora halotolerans]|uniref:Polyprenyl synthetase family protein n=1 Tax=Phytoactinopolyspora halotolerans TaxID=1981512 RepID=A0A6L9SJH2_9ACTN|nr:polyprenyl synthetase family protein [Phytoactinopolyspora halotolerans]NEE04230.1 polyprenyl synthetase family protein [Phytoactinopolyspora halotolerans]
MPSPADPVGPLRPAVQAVLDRFLTQQRTHLGAISPALVPLVDAAAELLRGGKRLRPAFCYWGWRAAYDDPDDGHDALIAAAGSLELFQAAALVHDDLIDGSDTRRGKPSAHRRFAAQHRAAGWSGASAHFGAAAAILLGDLLLGWSDELLSQAGLDAAALSRSRPVFELMRTEVGAGQYLDILAQADTAVSPAAQVERARQVIRHKSARYSVQHPLVLGGRIADAPDELIDGYRDYGIALGEAFQLRDDILGVFGDPAQTGKPAGDDLREGKRTLLVAYAAERADAAQAALIDDLLGDPDLDSSGVDRLRDVLVDTRARERVEARITDRVTEAERTVAGMKATDDGRAALTALIALATTRTH